MCSVRLLLGIQLALHSRLVQADKCCNARFVACLRGDKTTCPSQRQISRLKLRLLIADLLQNLLRVFANLFAILLGIGPR